MFYYTGKLTNQPAKRSIKYDKYKRAQFRAKGPFLQCRGKEIR